MIKLQGGEVNCLDRTGGEPGRLLVVDDNVEYLKTLELLLENMPFDCRYFADGPSAIDAARAEEFDVLLVDVRMAPLDGVETARAIKELQPLVAVIMMTGYDKEDTPLEALRLGAIDYIDKPITNAAAFLRMLSNQVRLVRSAKQLRATKERLEAVVENVDAAVVVLNAEGVIEEINPPAVPLVAPDASAGTLIGRRFREVCQIPELHFLNPHQETINKTFDLPIGGQKHLFQVSATRLEGLPGRPSGTVLLIKDLTAVAEWQQAEGWRQMSRAITHGMKTPLATMRMRLERLKAKPECASMSGELRMLLGVVDELHARLRDMVDFVKLDITPTPGDVNLAVGRAVRRFQSHHPDARIIFRPCGTPLLAPHAPAALELAIENLLSNSQEAGGEPVTIELQLERDDEHRQAVITVCDDGAGIPSELRDEVFRKPLNSTKPGGSGLGTALVKYIVDQHHGSLVWHSPINPQGRGTRVTLRLPLAENQLFNHG
jgi:nitrogen fixation/metabolism regulation signal transduction histidine kinase